MSEPSIWPVCNGGHELSEGYGQRPSIDNGPFPELPEVGSRTRPAAQHAQERADPPSRGLWLNETADIGGQFICCGIRDHPDAVAGDPCSPRHLRDRNALQLPFFVLS